MKKFKGKKISKKDLNNIKGGLTVAETCDLLFKDKHPEEITAEGHQWMAENC